MPKIIKTIKLTKGLEIGEDFVEVLEFCEPTVADLLSADREEAGSYGEEVALMSALCGIEKRHLGRMSLEDFARCREIVVTVSLMVDHGIAWDAAQKIVHDAQTLVLEHGGTTAGEPKAPASSGAGETVQGI